MLLQATFLEILSKATNTSVLPEEVKNGVLLHRFIDHFTDTTELNQATRDKLRPHCGKYGGVAMDLIHDRLLGNDLAMIGQINRLRSL